MGTTLDTSWNAIATELTWVGVAGYSLEKIHTGVIAHALNRGTPASKALAASLWCHASTESITADDITQVSAKSEVSLGDGPDSVIDLMVSITTVRGVHRLGLELKVDAPPRKEQLERLDQGLRGQKGVAAATVLLALSAAQVCRVERGHPPGVSRWGLDDLLVRGELLLEAGDRTIVEPWLRELAFERARRDGTDAVTEADARRFGYRERTWRAYELARWARQFARGGPQQWEVSMQSHNVVMTAMGSWRTVSTGGPEVTTYLEIAGNELCLKAGCWSGKADPRAASAAVAVRAFAVFEQRGLRPSWATRRQGRSATLVKIPLGAGDGRDEVLRGGLDAWVSLWREDDRSQTKTSDSPC